MFINGVRDGEGPAALTARRAACLEPTASELNGGGGGSGGKQQMDVDEEKRENLKKSPSDVLEKSFWKAFKRPLKGL